MRAAAPLLPRRLASLLIALALAVSAARLPAQVQNAPIMRAPVKTDSLSQATARADADYKVQAQQLEAENRKLKSDLATQTDLTERVGTLEKTVANAEARDRLTRLHRVGEIQARYAKGFDLFRVITLKTTDFSSQLDAAAAYEKIRHVSNLQEYAGFNEAFEAVKKKLSNTDEKNWLAGLLTSAIPNVANLTASFASVQPVIGLANFALKRLEGALPPWVKDNFHGKEFATKMDQLTCGLQTVSSVNNDLITSAAQSAQLAQHVDSVKRLLLPPALSAYVRLVGSSTSADPDDFYRVTTKYFAALSDSSDDAVTLAEERFADQASKLDGVARDYGQSVDRQLAYWQAVRSNLQARRALPCLGDDAAALARFDAAIKDIDKAEKSFRDAYLFITQNQSAREYFIKARQ